METIKLKFLSEISKFISKENIIDGDNVDATSYLKESRGNFISSAMFILLPETTNEVQQIIKLCIALNIAIIPQAGNTGLTGGTVSTKDCIILNSSKLNKILGIDIENYTITVQAGCTLREIQEYADKHNLMFPLSLASYKECEIAGNIASNAGGLSALKYGSTGDLVLGLEVVLANGETFSDLNSLRKRNIGPQIKSLFIASEGILGFITKATLKLTPKIKSHINVLISVENISQCKKIFDSFYTTFQPFMSSFEVFNKNALELISIHYPDICLPLGISNWQILCSLDLLDDDINLLDYIKNKMKTLLIQNSVQQECYQISHNDKVWEIRTNIPSSQSLYGESLKHDISVPLSKITVLLETLPMMLENNYPNIFKPIVFGHMGDGNIHYNISAKDPHKKIKHLADEVKSMIVNYTMSLNGTFAAEHGIGLVNKSYMKQFYSHNHLNHLKLIKQLFDPNNRFNPNKII